VARAGTCKGEEALIRKKLAGMPGVSEPAFNLMQRTLKVRHTPSALPAITEDLLFFALTFTGHATMRMAVFADVGASLLVVANGLWALGK
jgi:Cd2+/Zn2+-exporting ATPase